MRAFLFLLTLVALGALAFFCVTRHVPRIHAELATQAELEAPSQTATAAPKMQAPELAEIAPEPEESVVPLLPESAPEPTAESVEFPPIVQFQSETVAVEPSPVDAPATTPTAPAFYQFNVQYNGKILRLSGEVESEAMRQHVLERAKARFDGTQLINDMRVSAGAPSGWKAMITEAVLPNIHHFERVAFRLNQGRLLITGQTASRKAKAEAEIALAGDMLAGYGLAYDIHAPRPSPEPADPLTTDAE